MSDIKISDMTPWVGAVTGNVEFPAVFANENYRIALSQLTTSTFGFGSMALQNSNAVNITGGNIAVTTLFGAVTIANGGTGATDAPTALTNLGAYPATNPNGYTTNTGTVTSIDLTAGTGISVSGGPITSSGAIAVVNTAPDQIVALTGAGLTTVTGTYPNFTITSSAGTGTVSSVAASGGTTGLTFSGSPITTAGTLTLGGTLAVANGGTGATSAGAALTSLGAAASGANTDITSIALTTGTISTTPSGGTDIVNKAYADSIASGINFHQAVRLATTAALPANTYNNGSSGVGATLTANANGALSVDGVTAVIGNRILVKDEVTQANNGVYTVTQVGSGAAVYILTRATDFDSSGSGVDQIDAGDFFLVTAGTTLTNTSFVQQTPLPIVVGTTAIVFTQFGAPITYSAGTGLSLAGTVFSITNTGVTASTYGSASSVPVLAINAQGQTTSVTNTSIAIAGSQITSGSVAVAQGGTGATDAATALTNLGAYPATNPSGFTTNTGTVTSVGGTGTVNGMTLTGTVTTSGSLTLGGTLSGVSLTSQVTGTLPIANGGTGQTSYTDGQLLIGNTATGSLTKATLTAGSGISITNGNGSISIASTAGGGTVTSVDVSGGTTGLTFSGGPVTTSGTITMAGTLAIANGGTNGTATPTAGTVAYGTGTAYAFTSAGTTGQVLLSNGASTPSWGGIDGGTF